MKKFLTFFFVGAFWLSISGLIIANPAAVSAADEYTPLNFTPQIKLDVKAVPELNQNSILVGKYDKGVMTSDLLAKYIKGFYNYGLMICGILAAVVLMGGGTLWLISGGDSGKITQAKELITGSIIGSFILFSSWIILNTINPDLLNLKSVKTDIIKTANITCCQYNNDKAEMTSEESCKKNNGSPKKDPPNTIGYSPYVMNTAGTKCTRPGCCVFEDAKGNVARCLNTLEEFCSSTFKAQNCDLFPGNLTENGLSSCKGKVDICATAKDGAHCFEDTGDNSQSNSGASLYYCYYHVCYYGAGSLNEPCGNETSTCQPPRDGYTLWSVGFQSPCKDNFSHDVFGGRKCGEGLYCCKPN